jgi:hypothetical protein
MNMHGCKLPMGPQRKPWWLRWNEFPNPTLDAVLAAFGIGVIIGVMIFLFSL